MHNQPIAEAMSPNKSFMKSTDVKRFLRQHLGIKASVTTIPCKARWIEAFILGNFDPATRQYTYTQAFPEPFRRTCLQTVYPNSPVGDQSSGGNIASNRIAMLPHEWDKATTAFLRARQPADMPPW